MSTVVMALWLGLTSLVGTVVDTEPPSSGDDTNPGVIVVDIIGA